MRGQERIESPSAAIRRGRGLDWQGLPGMARRTDVGETSGMESTGHGRDWMWGERGLT